MTLALTLLFTVNLYRKLQRIEKPHAHYLPSH
jgi:hypothetical protein